jgi:hypothetical protein
MPATAESASTKPNIVFILVDNVGWGDFGVYRIETFGSNRGVVLAA